MGSSCIGGLQWTVPGCKRPGDNNSNSCPILEVSCVIYGRLTQLPGASLTSFSARGCRVAAFLHERPEEPSIMRVLKQNGSRAAVLVGATDVQLQKSRAIDMIWRNLHCYWYLLAAWYLWLQFGRLCTLNTCFEPTGKQWLMLRVCFLRK